MVIHYLDVVLDVLLLFNTKMISQCALDEVPPPLPPPVEVDLRIVFIAMPPPRTREYGQKLLFGPSSRWTRKEEEKKPPPPVEVDLRIISPTTAGRHDGPEQRGSYARICTPNLHPKSEPQS